MTMLIGLDRQRRADRGGELADAGDHHRVSETDVLRCRRRWARAQAEAQAQARAQAQAEAQAQGWETTAGRP